MNKAVMKMCIFQKKFVSLLTSCCKAKLEKKKTPWEGGV